MKRFYLILTALLLTFALFSGCSGDGAPESGRISIVTTIFPIYDWVRQIIGEENMDAFDLSFVINSRVDLHSYNPSVSDIARIKTSDAFIYVGGHSDDWVADVLRDAGPDMVTLNLLGILGDFVIRGEEYGCGDDCDDDHDHAPGQLHTDEHVWVSLRRVEVICAAIAAVLSELDPANAGAYNANLKAYTARLSALDAEYQAVADAADVKTLVFADRFPFRYLIQDYGLTHFAAFAGCSAETEASFSVIISLADVVNRLELNAVMVTETSDQSIARTVIGNTAAKNQRILVLDSLKSVTLADARNGASYLSAMESNLAVLKEALN
ncbi:MAG: metal ABC transporter substrate-binding protein [Defluviitaleaceae bacterium]|nr:metal ABC transporter substrate-binding protein [Defluviitaleaceae bacterium]MCL2836094.1 metal ABC transporter substrate-binding protein [Defluviitaleaceae bacterium]